MQQEREYPMGLRWLNRHELHKLRFEWSQPHDTAADTVQKQMHQDRGEECDGYGPQAGCPNGRQRDTCNDSPEKRNVYPISMMVDRPVINEVEEQQVYVWQHGPDNGSGKHRSAPAGYFPQAIS